jgi:regulator of sirC expression with transglutaminase-like and TPR domain
VEYLRQLLEGDARAKVRLDRAALELATIQYPDLELAPSLDRLNELASGLGDRMRNFNDGRDFVETAQRYLFEELGFHGNEQDYFDPLNSCLNQVLERRTGIPVTLSVMYMEIARRLAMPVFGIGLPRHFILQFDDGNYAAFIDPFHGGQTVTPRQCFALAGAPVADLSLLRRVTPRDILLRMLQNLVACYRRRQDTERAVAALDLLIFAKAPAIGECHKQRAACLIELKRYLDARRDLEVYLALSPDAEDREQVLRQMEAIHRWLGRVN